MKRRIFFLSLMLLPIVSLLSFLGYFGPRQTVVGDQLQPLKNLELPALAEVSGLIESTTRPGFLWAHNDSGNEPNLFCLDTSGRLQVPPGEDAESFQGIQVEGATLVDWEDIARHGDRLYITDMGNNLNARRHLGVYEVVEPSPQARSVKVERFFEVEYPDQKTFPPRDRWRYDCEAAFYHDGALYFLTKERPAYRLFVQQGNTTLYRLDLATVKERNILEKVDRATGLGGWVTAADVSHDGRYLALVCESPVQSIWLYELPPDSDKLLSEALVVKQYVFHHGGQLESLAFVKDGESEVLMMMNEEQELFRVEMERFQVVRRQTAPSGH